MAENGASRQQCPTEHIAHGAVEIPTVEEAIAMTMAVGGFGIVCAVCVCGLGEPRRARRGRCGGGVAAVSHETLGARGKPMEERNASWTTGSSNQWKHNPRNVGMSETAADKVADLRAAISAQNGNRLNP
jgi:hypothetical protein